MNKLTMLGTGNAFSHSADNPSAFLLEHDGYKMLLDCGPSILPSLYRMGVNPDLIDAIYISHLHPDHYFGILFMYLDLYYAYDLKQAITIYTPTGGKNLILTNLRNMYSDKECDKLSEIFVFDEFDLMNKEFSKGTIETIKAVHGANARMLILTLDSGIKIAYSGDTAFDLEMYKKLIHCDYVLHEATTFDTFIPNHTQLVEIMEYKDIIPASCTVYLIHHDNTVVDKIDFVNSNSSRIIIPRDFDVIDLGV